MKSCSKCNVPLEKGAKRWKFQSVEASGAPGKTGYLCSKCFHDVNKGKAKANSESRSQTCVKCHAAFVKCRTRSSPEADRLCPTCFHDVELVKANNAKPIKTCLNCKKAFVKSKKHKAAYRRKSKRACSIPPEAFDGEDGFLCYKCIPKVQKQLQIRVQPKVKRAPKSQGTVRSHSMETRKKVVSVPLFFRSNFKSSSNLDSKLESKKTKKTWAFKKKAIADINCGNYNGAFGTLLERSQRARQAFYKVASRYIKEEIKAYPKQGILANSAKFDDYLNLIPWTDIVEEASSSMPFLVQVLKAALPNPAKWGSTKKQRLLGQKCLTVKQANVILDRRLGFMLSVILFSHKPLMFSFIQGCVSLQLRKYRCGKNLMKCLYGMGVVKGLHGTVRMIEALKRQKQSLESSSERMSKANQGDLASCSPAVDLQSMFKERSDGAESDDGLDLVEQLLGVTSMDF